MVAENLNPSSVVSTGPLLLLDGVTVGNMTKTNLTYRTGTDTSEAEISTPVWRTNVSLPGTTSGATHDIQVKTQSDTISFPVKWKSSLNTIQASNASDAVAAIRNCLNGASADVDVIESILPATLVAV